MKLNLNFGVHSSYNNRCKAAVFNVNNIDYAILSLDLKYMTYESVNRIKEAVHKKAGIEAENLILVLSDIRDVRMVSDSYDEYSQEIEKYAAEAVLEAKKGMAPSALGFGSANIPHLIYNHRMVTRNLRVTSKWNGVLPGQVIGVEGPVDPELQVITVRNEIGKPVCLFWNFAAALTKEEPGEKSLPCMVEDKFQELFGMDIPVICLPGCGGNISYHYGKEQTSQELASAIYAAMKTTSADKNTRIKMKRLQVVLPYKDMESYYNFGDIEQKYPEGLKLFRNEYEKMKADSKPATRTSIAAMKINDFAIVTFPGIPFVELALELKQQSSKKVICAANVDSGLGYILTERSFSGGGYETWIASWSMLARGTGEFLTGKLQHLLGRE